MRAVDAVMECLKAEGVDVVFGLPGGANLPTYDAFVRRAASATSSCATRPAAATPPRATRRRPARSASALATSGPGATNLVTPIMDAMMDSVPIVFITGQVRTDLLGTDGFQEADMLGITMPAVKHSFMIQHPLEIPRAIHEAFHLARTGPARARSSSTSRPTSRAPTSPTSRSTDVHLPGYQPTTEGNAEADPPGRQGAGRRAPAGALRRRRRRQRQRVGRAASSSRPRTASRSPAR